MALTNLNWDIINKNLFVEGNKFWRTGYYNKKTGEETYVCSEGKRTKCPCTALVRYFKRRENDNNVEDGGEEHVSDDERGDSADDEGYDMDLWKEDPR